MSFENGVFVPGQNPSENVRGSPRGRNNGGGRSRSRRGNNIDH